MKKLLYTFLILTSLFSCEKYPGPGEEFLEEFYCSIIGNNQTAEADHYLSQKIGAQIIQYFPSDQAKQFRMKIEVTEGGGIVDSDIIYADNNGEMTTQWELGNSSNEQVLSCQVLDPENKVYIEFTIEATAFFLDQWNTVKTGYLVGIQDMVADTVKQRSMMYTQGQFWVSDNNFYTWKPKGPPTNTYIRMIDINSEGTVFAAGWDGALYKTEDWGENWIYICKPIPGNDHFYNFNITSDDYLWATKNSFGVFCSKDKGLTWTKDTTERIKNTTLGPIYKYKNSYVTLAGDPLSIIQKGLDSLSWTDLNTPEYSLSMYVPNDSTIIAQNQGGFKLHKSTDDGINYKQVFAPSTTMGGGDLWHIYNHFGNDYYVLAPSSGVWYTKNFEDFEQLIQISTYQSKLFIDHTGTIYAVGLDYSNAENEATYILPSPH